MNTQDTLLAFSEWLDSNGLMDATVRPMVTHDELSKEFITWWHENDDTPCVKRAPLAGEVSLPNTMGKWLYLRMRNKLGPVYRSIEWEDLTTDDQEYWDHEARATERAVHRGGFKYNTKEEYDNEH